MLGPWPKITSVVFFASVRSCLCSNAHPRFIIGSGWLSGRKKCHACQFCGYTMSERIFFQRGSSITCDLRAWGLFVDYPQMTITPL